jgi:predicted deacetylase
MMAPAKAPETPTMPPTFAAFTEAEHRERLGRARRALARAGFEACVSVAPEHLYYDHAFAGRQYGEG